MKHLIKSVTDYNATYGTIFRVINPIFSLYDISGEVKLETLNQQPNTGGVFLFYDQNKNLLAVYSAKNFYDGLKSHIKTQKDNSGNWIVKGTWVSNPVYIAFVCGDQNRLYEKDSLRTFLIKELNARYDENGNLTR